MSDDGMDHGVKARQIVEDWAEDKNGSFSGSDLWALIRDIENALRAVEQSKS